MLGILAAITDRIDSHLAEGFIVGGIMAHLAVAMTAQDGAVLGYHVVVAADATTTRALPGQAGGSAVDADTVKRVSLSIIADRFADVMTSAEIRALAR